MVMIKLKNVVPVDFTQKKQGFFAVFVGVIIALILGILVSWLNWGATWIWWVLALGLIVGILNIFHEEGILFVLTLLSLSFMLTLLASLTLFPAWAVILFNAVTYLMVPVGVIVSLKVLYALAVK